MDQTFFVSGGQSGSHLAAEVQDLVQVKRAGQRLVVHGCDISETGLEYARAQAARKRAEGVHFFTQDVLQDGIPPGYDVVTCSLFLHHLEEASAVALLRKMAKAARELVVVDDLLRTATGYWLAWFGCRLLTRSPVVHHDGPISVEAAFQLHEVLALAKQAGLTGVKIRRRFPQRFVLTWSRAHG